MGEEGTDGVEHYVTIESTQVFQGEVMPSEAELLTGDGSPPDHQTWKGNQSASLEFHDEVKCTFECNCGRRFRKPETAREHLEGVRSDG